MTDYDTLLAAGIEKFDAAFAAALKTNFSAYQIDERDGVKCISILIEAAPNKALPDCSVKLYEYFATFKTCRIANIATNPVYGFQYYSADVSFDVLLLLVKEQCVTHIQLCALLKPTRNVKHARRNDCVATSPAASIAQSSKRSIVATIDHGCPFAHIAFRSQTGYGTRVFSIWDQDENPEFVASTGSIPINFGYGRQISQTQLNSFMSASMRNGVVNDELCYELASYSAMRARWTHGGASLGLLASSSVSPSLKPTTAPAGTGSTATNMSDIDIVFVQLPRGIPLAPTAGATDRSLLDGVAYIVATAGETTQEITIVIDYGTYLGPHDGSSVFEKALDTIVESLKNKIQLTIVFASGNGYNKDIHARLKQDAPARISHAVDWWVPPDNDCANFADIWLTKQSLPCVFSASSPSDTPLEITLTTGATETVASVSKDKSLAVVVKPHGDQYQIFLQISPTRHSTDDIPKAAFGRWKLAFEFEKNVGNDIDLYTNWGGRNSGFPQRVMASKFLRNTASQTQYLAVTGDGSLIGSGCGQNTMVVGGYEKWGGQLRADYSGAGSARGGKRGVAGKTKGVDVLAISDESPSLLGLLCVGSRSGAVVRVNGTSFAAPQVARAVAFAGWKLPAIPPSRKLDAPSTVSSGRQEYDEPRFP